MESGKITDQSLHQAYGDNLRRVMGEVALLASHLQDKFDNIAIMGITERLSANIDNITIASSIRKSEQFPGGEVINAKWEVIPNREINTDTTDKHDERSVEDLLEDLGCI